MDENGGMVNPTKLRFTQPDIAPYFQDTTLPKVEEAVNLIRVGFLNPAVFGELVVHRDSEGVLWCENNRRLFVLRKAGVGSVKVKFNYNGYFSGRLKEEDKKKLSDPAFVPRIRGGTSSSSTQQQRPYEGKEEMSLQGVVSAISGVVATGCDAWNLYNQFSQMLSHHDDDKDNEAVNPAKLRFTQLDIGQYFQDRESPTVEETVRLIQRGHLDPAQFGKLTVHRDKEGVLWCENNRRLYVLRKAGVRSVKVKFNNNDFNSRRHKEEDKKKLSDPTFMPRFRGGTSSSSSSTQSTMLGCTYNEGKKETSMAEIMGAVSVVGAGYAALKLFSQSHHDDDDK